jgi:glucoside 3-dehydrogenase (cytochrome c) hitch-hiker subunit
VRRRRALEILGTAAAAPALFPGLGARELFALGARVRRGLVPGDRRVLATLSPAQARTVTAVGEVILPRTDTPGATDAGVVDFIDVMLSDWLDPGDRDRLVAGVDEIDRRSRAAEGAAFDECTEEGRIAIVAALDAEVDALRRDEAGRTSDHFFYDLKRFVIAGYFTSEPVWRALGYRVVPGSWDACRILDAYGAGEDR